MPISSVRFVDAFLAVFAHFHSAHFPSIARNGFEISHFPVCSTIPSPSHFKRPFLIWQKLTAERTALFNFIFMRTEIQSNRAWLSHCRVQMIQYTWSVRSAFQQNTRLHKIQFPVPLFNRQWSFNHKSLLPFRIVNFFHFLFHFSDSNPVPFSRH